MEDSRQGHIMEDRERQIDRGHREGMKIYFNEPIRRCTEIYLQLCRG